jgi:hypothetical protein
MSSENHKTMGADGVRLTGRQHGGARQRECVDGPAESKTPRMHRNFTRENREAQLVIRRKRTDRWEKAMSYKAHMNDDRDSSSGIVPTKRLNEDRGGSKGTVEERPLAEENATQPIPAPDIEPDEWANNG